MLYKPRKVLLKLSDEQWNVLRSVAVGQFGQTAGAFCETLVLEHLRAKGHLPPAGAPAPVPGQLSLPATSATKAPRRPRKARTVPTRSRKDSKR